MFPACRRQAFPARPSARAPLYVQKVAVVPGTAFWRFGRGFVRISYAYSVNHLTEALDRIQAFLQEREASAAHG